MDCFDLMLSVGTGCSMIGTEADFFKTKNKLFLKKKLVFFFVKFSFLNL